MDDGFALRFDGNQQVDVVRHAITQDDHAAAACGRPLSKQDMRKRILGRTFPVFA
jgi:hypothetical protein